MNAASLEIRNSDLVFATLEANGQIIARLSAMNFGSVGEV